MEEEIKNLIKVCISVLVSLCYCYFLASKIPEGKIRLISLVPIFYFFTILPLIFSSIHLRAISAFFLTWLANFKLIVFSFNTGPLAHQTSLLNFICIASLPIKSRESPSSQSPQKQPLDLIPMYKMPGEEGKDSPPQKKPKFAKCIRKIPTGILIKGFLLAIVIHMYEYIQRFHQYFLWVAYCFHLYLALELVLATGAVLARALVGFEIEPQFNEPYLSTSLQDFWGRRWNLMVTSILRPTVYNPVRQFCHLKLGKDVAQLAGVMATFFVSAIMHEFIFYYHYYLTLWGPTWEVTCFFLLHGICTGVEIWVKRILPDKWVLPVVISRVVTVVFVAVTGFWLFFPPFIRSKADGQFVQESIVLLEFLKEKCWNLTQWTVA